MHYMLFIKNPHPSILFLLFLFASHLNTIYGQAGYWQQKVQYEMQVDMDVHTHQYEGKQLAKLFNNSPDTLYKIYYHLYFNAFQPGSEMDIRSRTIIDPDPRIGNRISKLDVKDQGFIHITKAFQNRLSLKFEEEGTILSVHLIKPCPPGDSVNLELQFHAQVPLQIRRCGRNNKEGINYSMSQWYPKICNYDRNGWQANPYIAREFYGIWGDYKVQIRIDSSYCLGFTGLLQNPGNNPCQKPNQINDFAKRSWIIEAKNVHDFVWAADPDYTQTSYTRENGTLLKFYYQDEEAYRDAWNKLPVIMDTVMHFIERRYGPYPYPCYSFIQGGDGGMEYPMATLITGRRPLNSLIGVATHELSHSWFQMMLATNEALHPWMDEGFTSYIEAEAIEYLKELNIYPGIPSGNPHSEHLQDYIMFTKTGQEEALCTPADYYTTNRAYGVASYVKGAVCLSQLKYIMGDTIFSKAMLNYYWKWRFKHPDPDAFFKVMETTSDLDLKWFKYHFIHTTHHMDYAIDSVQSQDKQSLCMIRNKGDFPMPVELIITLKNGKFYRHYIPLSEMRGVKIFSSKISVMTQKPWDWVNPMYTLQLNIPKEDILSIQLNPESKMADVNPSNDLWQAASE